MSWQHGPTCPPPPTPAPTPVPTPTPTLDFFVGGAELLVFRRPLPLLLPFPLALDCCVGGADLLVLCRPLPLLLPLPLSLGAQAIRPVRSSRVSLRLRHLPARVDCCVGGRQRRGNAQTPLPFLSFLPFLPHSASLLPPTTEGAGDVVAIPVAFVVKKAYGATARWRADHCAPCWESLWSARDKHPPRTRRVR